jgi:hypothetical protein
MTGFVEVSQNEMMVVDGGGPFAIGQGVAAVIFCSVTGGVAGFCISGGQPVGALIGAGAGALIGIGAFLM